MEIMRRDGTAAKECPMVKVNVCCYYILIAFFFYPNKQLIGFQGIVSASETIRDSALDAKPLRMDQYMTDYSKTAPVHRQHGK